MNYALVSPLGVILQTSTHPVDAAPGYACIPAPDGVSGSTHYVSGDLFIAIPPQPSPVHGFDWDTHQWVDARTLERHQADAEDEIAARIRLLEATQVRTIRDHAALTILAAADSSYAPALAAEVERLSAAYQAVLALRAKLAEIAAAETHGEVEAALAGD